MNVWRAALEVAEDVFTPDRTELMRTFQDIVLDDHLKAVMNNRVLAATSGSFFIYKEGEEEHDEELTGLFQADWLDSFMRLVVESRFYGYSLIQLGDVVGSSFESVEGVPREYVDPVRRGVKKGLFLSSDVDIVPIDEGPFKTWTILVGSPEDLGLINSAVPLIIWKKNVLQSWSQFAELFGMPWRVGKTDVDDATRRKNMAEMMENMGGAPWAVIDQEDAFEFIETTGSDAYQVFEILAQRADKGVSKLFLGQTMTTEDGASRSQAEVHERVMDQITRSDKKLIERVINNDLIPRMVRIGMIPEGVQFFWDQEESLDFEQRLKGIEVLARSGFKISPEKIEELTGIAVEEKEKTTPPSIIKKEEEDLAARMEEINDLYMNAIKNSHQCDH